ncbi:MAG TPA: hypothetical protein VD887_06115 [Allosphingosinicella sp.]|nr:hypothetical protein [Allosphingosinicella sp.]HYG29775.1 hypothetical protein [Allosphingosinicella sp.]
MKILLSLLCALLLAACATVSAAPDASDSLDAIAGDYVRLQLVIGEKEEGYIDAYYGPPEWRAQARAQAAAATLPQLRQRIAALLGRIGGVEASSSWPAGSIEARRPAFLRAQLVAADTRLRMMQGERLGFAEEAQGLFGVSPEIRPLPAYDPLLARIERLVPGPGTLADRVDAFQNRFTIPADRLDAAMRAAIAECRRRTLEHIALPPEERFTLEFVTGRSWSGYNWYQGNYASLIQINTDLPVKLGRAVDLGCHEGYPGHHVHNMLLERNLARRRNWVEYSVYPLYSPQSLIAEGSANYGYELAFPGGERLAFETGTIYPLAGLPTADAARYLELQEALEDLAGARFTIARDLLEGRISRAEAVRLTQRYQLVSVQRAEQSIAFTEQYRSYVINYGLGRDMIAAFIEAQGPDQATRWRAMERILSEPTLPADLLLSARN